MMGHSLRGVVGAALALLLWPRGVGAQEADYDLEEIEAGKPAEMNQPPTPSVGAA